MLQNEQSLMIEAIINAFVTPSCTGDELLDLCLDESSEPALRQKHDDLIQNCMAIHFGEWLKRQHLVE